MRQNHFPILLLAVALLLTAGCGSRVSKAEKARSKQLVEATAKEKNYDRLMRVADSLEQAGSLSVATAAYWRGYACDRKKQADKAEQQWRASMKAAEVSQDPDDLDAYVKSASRLANMLCLRGDYEATLAMAQPVVARLEAMKCDTTSDYVNLLIYIGCCQATVGKQVEEVDHGFYRAYKKHLENIERRRSDDAYKDAIAGLINVAFYCVQAGKFNDALYYTRYFGELVGEYEQREGVSADYIDRQVGRYGVYKAEALAGLGRKKEADEVFKAFEATQFSKTAEGQALAKEYLGK